MYRAFEGEFPIETKFDDIWFTIIASTGVEDAERVVESILIRTDFSPTIDRGVTSVEGINVARSLLHDVTDEEALDVAKERALESLIAWRNDTCPQSHIAGVRDITDDLPNALEAVWKCRKSDVIMTSISFESPCPKLRALFRYVITGER
jgi:hypothetical protein